MEQTAFKIWPVIDRRRQEGGPVQPIRSVAVDQGGSKLYLGLEEGLLEEHTLVKKTGTVAASLSARKHVSKKVPAVAVCCCDLGAAALGSWWLGFSSPTHHDLAGALYYDSRVTLCRAYLLWHTWERWQTAWRC